MEYNFFCDFGTMLSFFFISFESMIVIAIEFKTITGCHSSVLTNII